MIQFKLGDKLRNRYGHHYEVSCNPMFIGDEIKGDREVMVYGPTMGSSPLLLTNEKLNEYGYTLRK